MGYLDPELAALILGAPPTDIREPGAARARLAALRGARPPFEVPAELRREWHTVPASSPVRVLALRPAAAGPLRPAIIYLHGGGFVMGDAEGDQVIAAQLARAAGAVVLSVDYRLAPENRFPAAHDDGYAVLRWAAERAGPLGIAPDRLAIAGSSAGAAIAAGIALRARDEGGPPLAAQLLEIPVVDDRAETPSAQYLDTPLWNRGNILDSWAHYLGRRTPAQAVSAYAAPARATDLAGLPPAYVGVCGTDPLRDEGIAYAQRLAHDGVPTELRMYPGLFHGAAGLFPEVAACRRARAALLDAAARLLTV